MIRQAIIDRDIVVANYQGQRSGNVPAANRQEKWATTSFPLSVRGRTQQGFEAGRITGQLAMLIC
jgi:hypothetical protein